MGSEMCIRDRFTAVLSGGVVAGAVAATQATNTVTSAVLATIDATVTSTRAGIAVLASTSTTITSEVTSVAIAVGLGGATTQVRATVLANGSTTASLGSSADLTAANGAVVVTALAGLRGTSDLQGGAGSIGLATLRRDGFGSLSRKVAEEEGHFITSPFEAKEIALIVEGDEADAGDEAVVAADLQVRRVGYGVVSGFSRTVCVLGYRWSGFSPNGDASSRNVRL